MPQPVKIPIETGYDRHTQHDNIDAPLENAYHTDEQHLFTQLCYELHDIPYYFGRTTNNR